MRLRDGLQAGDHVRMPAQAHPTIRFAVDLLRRDRQSWISIEPSSHIRNLPHLNDQRSVIVVLVESATG